MWSTGEGNGKPRQYSCPENPMNSIKRQNDRILKDELPRLVGAKYATRDQWRNNSRNNEGMEPKQKPYPAVDVNDDRSKIRCCKEQYCIGTWNVRSMNQGKLDLGKQEIARVNVDILGISELNRMEMGESESRSVMSDSLRPHGLHSPWNSADQNTGVGSLFLLQGIFPTQGLNPGLLHCRWILYQLSYG